jgi:hypothetical protein
MWDTLYFTLALVKLFLFRLFFLCYVYLFQRKISLCLLKCCWVSHPTPPDRELKWKIKKIKKLWVNHLLHVGHCFNAQVLITLFSHFLVLLARLVSVCLGHEECTMSYLGNKVQFPSECKLKEIKIVCSDKHLYSMFFLPITFILIAKYFAEINKFKIPNTFLKQKRTLHSRNSRDN